MSIGTSNVKITQTNRDFIKGQSIPTGNDRLFGHSTAVI